VGQLQFKFAVVRFQEHVLSMKPGSVIVDLAAETGGNVETTKPGEVYTLNDITHIGLTDLSSRLPTQSSTLYANNVSKFLLSIGAQDHFFINLADEVVRGSIILEKGKLMWPPPTPVGPPAPPPVAKAAPVQVAKEEENPLMANLKDSLMCTAGN
jgi:NAD(P) transhydrogenase